MVPLYTKIYLEAYVAKELILNLLKDSNLGFDFEPGFILRTFLSSSRSFKHHISNLALMDKLLKYNIQVTKMPKFIWIAEIYSKEGFQRTTSKAIGLIIIDATEANRTLDALIFASYPDRSIIMNENNLVVLSDKLHGYTYYSNLI